MTAQGRVEARARWRWLRHPGEETTVLRSLDEGWRFEGRIDTQFPEGPARARYTIDCDPSWRAREAHVRMTLAGARREVWLCSKEGGQWQFGGINRVELRGCADLDFSATPVTNTLPIRRLSLPVGGSADIRVAWLLFPDLVAVPTSQRYTRLSERRYRYESLEDHKLSTQGHFTAEFDVDAHGLVVDYPGYWERADVRSRT